MLGFIKRLFEKKKFVELEDMAFQEAYKNPGSKTLLDVRSKAEFDRLKIPNALNIDIANPNFRTRLDNMDKAKTYFVYCQTGNRSAKACRILTELGFEKVYSLKGGINSFSGRTV
jgi:rhodanese-related sulfurtransferase